MPGTKISALLGINRFYFQSSFPIKIENDESAIITKAYCPRDNRWNYYFIK